MSHILKGPDGHCLAYILAFLKTSLICLGKLRADGLCDMDQKVICINPLFPGVPYNWPKVVQI